MPVVPGFKRTKDDAIELRSPKLNVQVSPDSTLRNLERVGGAISDLGNVMTNVVIKQRREKDEASAREAYVSQAEKATIYREQVFAQTGKDVDGSVARAKEDYKKMSENTINQHKLTGYAAELFRAKSDNLYLSDQRVIARHQSTEMKKWKHQTINETLKAESNTLMSQMTALTAGEVTEYINQNINPVLDEAAQYTDKNVKDLKDTTKGLLYANAIDQALAKGETERARELIDTWDKQLLGKDRVRLNAALRSKELQIDSSTIAAEYLAEDRSQKDTIAFMKEDINDDELRTMTQRKYNALYKDQQVAERRKYVNNSYEYMQRVEELVQKEGLAAAQNFVNTLPREGKINRQVYNQVESLYARYASGKNADRFSDAAQYLWIGNEIEEGRITNERELRVLAGGKLTENDITEKVNQLLKAQDVPDRELKQNLAISLGVDNFDQLSKKEQEDIWYTYSVWAKEKIKQSNKASDPKYLQELSDAFVLNGETKRKQYGFGLVGFGVGYGPDKKFYQAIKDPSWIVDIEDDSETANTVTLTKSKVKLAIRKLINTGVWTDLVAAADGDEEVAVRRAWTQMLRDRLTDPDKVQELLMRGRSFKPLTPLQSAHRQQNVGEK